MRCPRCGETNEEGFKFCLHCGGVLPAAPDFAATRDVPSNLIAEPRLTPLEVKSPPPPTPPTYKLIATAGLLTGRTFTIGPKGLVIGRDSASCQVILADDEVSRHHAWVGYDDQGAAIIRDRNSANGTYVNQERINEKTLKPGDVISIGRGQRHLFRIEPAAPLAPAPEKEVT